VRGNITGLEDVAKQHEVNLSQMRLAWQQLPDKIGKEVWDRDQTLIQLS
jgi:hypothetical protein